MKKWLPFYLWFLVPFALAQQAPKPSLEPVVISSELSSVDEALDLYFTEPYPNTVGPRAHPGTDIVRFEVAQIRDLIRSPGDPKRKWIILERYGVGDPQVEAVLKEAASQGIPILFVTDLNRSLIFNGPERTSVDFSNLERMQNDTAKIIDGLLRGGEGAPPFAFNQSPLEIVSQPVFERAGDGMIDIYHEKTLLLIDQNRENPEIKLFHSTANLSREQRVNTLLENHDPKVAAIFVEHAQLEAETFRKGGIIRDIPPFAPREIRYKDGTVRIIRFTDGKYNPNDRMAEMLNSPDSYGFLSLNFVVTHRGVIEALMNRKKVDPDFFIRGVGDSTFVSNNGYSMLAALDGFMVSPPHGKANMGLGERATANVDLFVYSQVGVNPNTGNLFEETDEANFHLTRKLYHNKVSIVFRNVDGKKMAHVFIGSLNLSNHFQNAETQEEIIVPFDSWIVQSIIQDYEQLKETQGIETGTGSLVPLPLFMLKKELGKIAGHSDQSVTREMVNQAVDAILARDFPKLLSLIREIHALPTQLKSNVNAAELNVRLEKLGRFLDWYSTNVPPSQLGSPFRVRKLVAIVNLVNDPMMDPYRAWSVLDSIIWRPGLEPNEIFKLKKQAWITLGMKENFDFFKKRDPDPVSASPAVVMTNWVFDLDDNVLFMATPIYLFKKGTGERVEVSTNVWAEMKHLVGVEGTPWEGFEKPDKRSFVQFDKRLFGNHFEDQILDMLHKSNGVNQVWQAPSFRAFQEALSNPVTAKRVFINTARGHDPEEILAGLRILQEKGFIRFLPDVENIHCVGSAANPADAKLVVLEKIVSSITSNPVPADGPMVLSANGREQGHFHLLGFSDDDRQNFDKSVEFFKGLARAGKLENTKVTVFYTHREKPETVVITPEGETRRLQEGELDEVRRVVDYQTAAAARVIQASQNSCESKLNAPKTH